MPNDVGLTDKGGATAASRELSALIASVTALAEKKAGSKKPPQNADLFPRFIRQFFTGVPAEEISGRKPEALYDIAGAAWELLQSHKVGTPKITVVTMANGERSMIQIVNDDMPFLVSSVTCELERMDLGPLLVIHPVLTVQRDVDGTLTELRAASDGSVGMKRGDALESLMHIEIGGGAEDEMVSRLRDNLKAVLGDTRVAVRDWQAMRGKTGHLAADFEGPVGGVKPARTKEVVDFLHWLNDDHFTYLGYRQLLVKGSGKNRSFTVEHQHSLGVLTKSRLMIFEGVADGAPVPPQLADFLDSRNVLLILKANQRSTVHRRVHFDVIAVKMIDAKGAVAGIHMLVGLFTADVYTNSPNFVPVLRNKLERIRERVGFRKHSHDDKVLQNVMENLPRDELFETSDRQLMETALGVMQLQQRPRTAVFMRQDQFERFASVLAMAEVAVRIKNKTPQPGSDGKLRRFIDGFQHGQPNYDEMDPEAAVNYRTDLLQKYTDQFQKLGALTSLTFVDVTPRGGDKYAAIYEHSRAVMTIDLSADGKIDEIEIGEIKNP